LGGTGFLFLGRLGSRANTEKKGSRPIMSNFLGWFFHVLGVKNLNFFKNILATALKSYIKWLLYMFFFIEKV
jgi:hypothetical protein